MDNRGSKSVEIYSSSIVKEQRADGSSIPFKGVVRCALVAEKSVFERNIFNLL